jgi:hypothetical protein
MKVSIDRIASVRRIFALTDMVNLASLGQVAALAAEIDRRRESRAKTRPISRTARGGAEFSADKPAIARYLDERFRAAKIADRVPGATSGVQR